MTMIRPIRCYSLMRWAGAQRVDGPALVRRHDFAIEGSRPHNTGGGRLSMAQAGAAGGYRGLIEAMQQLLDAKQRPVGR
jgi:hypothetical protein